MRSFLFFMFLVHAPAKTIHLLCHRDGTDTLYATAVVSRSADDSSTYSDSGHLTVSIDGGYLRAVA